MLPSRRKTSELAAIRLLMLATRVPMVAGDGTPSFVLDNALPLADEFDLTILAPRVKGSPVTTMSGGVRVKRFAYMPRRWESLAEDAIMPQLGRRPGLWIQAAMLSLGMLAAAVGEICRRRPSGIHAQWILPAGLVGYLISIFFRTPYMVTSQGADAYRLETGPIGWMKRRIVARASLFVGVSADITRRFDGVSTTLATQPSGVDFAFWESTVGVRRPEKTRVVFVGRLASKKGVDVAIRAVAESDDLTLVIIGDGPERSRLEELTDALGARDRVAFIGQRSRNDVAAEFRTATCVVIPSVVALDGDRDGTPNVLGEAVAAGVPVVAARIAGLEELLVDRRHGLLHAPGDTVGLRSCLQQIIGDSSLAERLAATAKIELRDRLDLLRVAERYADWYRGLFVPQVKPLRRGG